MYKIKLVLNVVFFLVYNTTPAYGNKTNGSTTKLIKYT